MKVLCWNINKKYKILITLDVIMNHNADLVFLQEMKLNSKLDIELTKQYKYKFHNCSDTDVIAYSNVELIKLNKYDIPNSNFYILLEYNNIKFF